MRGRTVKGLKKFGLDPVAVENPAYPGTPDVNYIEGWIELKWARRWPVRPETVFKIDHFTPQQRNWLWRRWTKGGNAWLLLQVEKEYLLFTGRDAKDYVGKLTRAGLYKAARARWTGGMNWKELAICLGLDWDNWNGLPLVNGYSSSADGAERTKVLRPPDTASQDPSMGDGRETPRRDQTSRLDV